MRALLVLLLVFAAGCSRPDVVIYCAADQEYAEPILKDFEAKTGLTMKMVFDIEASKTVGLVRTILEEQSRPRCDVFWNNEVANTWHLMYCGALERFTSASAQAKSFPDEFVNKDGFYVAFAARARVLIVNTTKIQPQDYPKSIEDLANPKWRGRAGVARPIAGTTFTHFSTFLYSWGVPKTQEFCTSLIKNEVNLASGNGAVARLVADGVIDWGVVDTDDYNSQLLNKKPVAVIYPSAANGGTLVLPNTISLVRRAPHPENALRLIDYLLSPDVEARLAASPSANIPVRREISAPPNVRRLWEIDRAEADFSKIGAGVKDCMEILKAQFLK